MTPEKQQVSRSLPAKWQSNTEKEKRFIRLTVSSPWKGLIQWLDSCFTEYKYPYHQISQVQPTWSDWDDSTEVSL